jgi:tetratricopeptide (TPR) repeat protein
MLILAMIMVGCRERIEPETPDYVEYGWELMAEGDYRGAITQFEEGTDIDDDYADGWNGLGWAHAKLGVADTSNTNFSEGISKLGQSDTSVVVAELYAGRSFARLALGSFSGAVSDGKKALSEAPGWVFRRDPLVDYEHVELTIATGFYGLGVFDSSLVWVRKLDSEFTANVATIKGASRLAAKLADLEDDLKIVE